MFRKLLLGLGLASALGASFVPASPAFGCGACRQFLEARQAREYTGTLQYSFLCDTALPPRTSQWQLQTEKGGFGLWFGNPDLEKQAAKLTGKKVKVTGRLI